VGSAEKIIQFPVPEFDAVANYGEMSAAIVDRYPSEPVRMAPLDSLVPRNTRVIKIDTEGFEPDVLRGGDSTLRLHHAYWLLEAKPATSARVVEALTVKGYRLYWEHYTSL
jgi:FkbM family methyltransferase